MKWVNVHQLPEETGNYSASVRIPHADGQYIFTDLVHFDQGEQRWFKYDPFDAGNPIKEDITQFIVGWIDEMETYFGVV